MEFKNPKNIHMDSQDVEQDIQICPKCKQTYLFEVECPACNGKIKEESDKLMLSVRIKNITDILTPYNYFNESLDILQKIDSLLTLIVKKQKE